MKANRKFRGEDEAVSPVIAVILMVAITVVLAATVYVWVSGFGSNSSTPAKSLALSSGGALATSTNLDTDASPDNDDSYKLYVVSAASPGLKYSDLTFTLNGATATRSSGDCDSAELTDLVTDGAAAPSYIACAAAFTGTNTAARGASDLVQAGDHIYIMIEGTASMSGQTLRVLDSSANSIVLTLTVA
jgi:flagellin-like protein